MKKIILVILTIFLFTSCTKKDDTIKIGIAVGTSGKYASLGNSLKDGILLAFNEINYKINNKDIEIIQKDDQQDPNTDKKVIKELLDKNVKVILGNATSSMTKVSLNIINKRKGVLLFSPTASSNDFNNKDDNFIRIDGGDPRITLDELLKFIKINRFKNITIIGDSKNRSYLKTYTTILPKYLKDEKIITNKVKYIDSNLPLKTIATKLTQYKKTDLIIMATNSIDAATTIQYLRQHNTKTTIICAGWANDKNFFENIGNYANGLYFATFIENNNNNKQYKLFEKSFFNAYGKKPKKFNIIGYKSAQILIEALKECKNIENLKQVILHKKTFNTITGNITFNKYGDLQGRAVVIKIVNGKFKKVFNE